jgi:hypothetical protein
MAVRPICSIPGCGKPHKGRGLCSAHHARMLRNGDPFSGRTEEGAPQKYLETVAVPYRGDDCLPWPFVRSANGYGQLRLKSGKKQVASRAVCEAAHGPPPTPQHVAAHSCGNGHLGCVNPSHISWKTLSANMADKIIHGTMSYGERSGTAKLTASDVRKIRAMEQTHRKSEIARLFSVSAFQVGKILRGESWSHIK